MATPNKMNINNNYYNAIVAPYNNNKNLYNIPNYTPKHFSNVTGSIPNMASSGMSFNYFNSPMWKSDFEIWLDDHCTFPDKIIDKQGYEFKEEDINFINGLIDGNDKGYEYKKDDINFMNKLFNGSDK